MPSKNFDIIICNIDGTPAPTPDGSELTMRTIIAQALVAMVADETPEAKLRYGLLAMKLGGEEGEQDFSTEELADAKRAVGKNCGPLVVCQVFAEVDA